MAGASAATTATATGHSKPPVMAIAKVVDVLVISAGTCRGARVVGPIINTGEAATSQALASRPAVIKTRRDLYRRFTFLWNCESPSAKIKGTMATSSTLPRRRLIERVQPFNSLDVLVAIDEGLFDTEGLDLGIAAPVANWDINTTGTPLARMRIQGQLAEQHHLAFSLSTGGEDQGHNHRLLSAG